MTTFCLIHSSGQGPEGWKLVADELARRGHGVLTPAFDLERSDEGLAFHAATIVRALERSGCPAPPSQPITYTESRSRPSGNRSKASFLRSMG